MLHGRADYQDRIVDTAGAIPVDEPVFLLRAKDKFAPRMLKFYFSLLDPHDHEMRTSVAQQMRAMQDWQIDNGCDYPNAPPAEERATLLQQDDAGDEDDDTNKTLASSEKT